MTIRARLLPALILVATLAGCAYIGAPASGSPPTGSPPASPTLSVEPTAPPTAQATPSPTNAPPSSPIHVDRVESAAQAAAIVLASDPRFGDVAPLRSDVIGASAWYEAFNTGTGFRVEVTLGSGDCQAGCIDRHTWIYSVALDGTVMLISDSGDQVEVGTTHATTVPAQITIHLVAGPVCPVERNPPDPSCAPRPVAAAQVILHAADGVEVARGTSDADGAILFSVPGGSYYAEPLPVEGLLGLAESQALSVPGGSSAGLVMEYDTGIR